MGRKIGTILSYCTLMVDIFTAMFLTPIIIRNFGQSEYGVYTLTLSITAYLTLLDLGVGNSVTRFMAKYRANNQFIEQRRFLGVTSIYYIAISFIILIISAVLINLYPTVFAEGLTGEEVLLGQKLLIICAINIAFTLGTSGFFHTVVAYENFSLSKGVSILLSIIKVCVSLIALGLGAKSMVIALINLGATIVSRTIFVLYVILKMKLIPTLKNVDFKLIKNIISYSVFIFIQMISAQVNNVIGTSFIGIFATSASAVLAVYGVGTQIYQYFQSFGGALNSTLMAGVVKKVETDGSSSSLQTEMVRIGRLNLTFVGMVWTTFLLFGKQFITLWAGEANKDAYYVAVFLTLPFVFILTQNIGTQILWAKNQHKFQSCLKLIIVSINVVSTYFLVKWNVLWGATIGTFISLIIGDVLVMQIVFKKDIGLKLITYYKGLFKGIIPALLATAVIGSLFKLLYLSGWLGFFINCFVAVIIYVACMLVFGFNSYEKNLIKGIANKLFRRKKNESV